MKVLSREELNQVMAYYFKASFATKSEEADKEEWSRILQEVEKRSFPFLNGKELEISSRTLKGTNLLFG